MAIYKHALIRPWQIVAALLRGLAALLKLWPLLLVAAFFISPVGPHLRWEYTYRPIGSSRIMLACTYLGSRGLVDYMHGDECPVITFIDRRVY